MFGRNHGICAVRHICNAKFGLRPDAAKRSGIVTENLKFVGRDAVRGEIA
jgi:hypothetical protein